MREATELNAILTDAVKHLKIAEKNAEAAKSSINISDIDSTILEIEASYSKAFIAIDKLTSAIEEAVTIREGATELDARHHLQASEQAFSRQGHSKTGYITPDIFRCEVLGPPPLKQRGNAYPYEDYICAGLNENMSASSTAGLQAGIAKFKKCTVCLVNHVVGEGGKITPFYDNDNLAIKKILDIVVPYVVYDDSILYCDNFYVTQVSDRKFVEVFIINDGHMPDFLSLYRDYDFVKKLFGSRQ